MVADLPFAFHTLHPSDLPFTIELIQVGGNEDGKVLWTRTVEQPGALHIPGFGGQGFGVRARVTFPDRIVEEMPPVSANLDPAVITSPRRGSR